MAGKNAYPVRSVSTPKPLELSFKFRPNFTSTVSSSYVYPSLGITSITRTATGTWSVNLDAAYYSVSLGAAYRQGADLGGQFSVANVSDVVSGYTGNTVVQIRHDISGTATDIATASTNWVHVTLKCADSSVGM